MLVEFWWLSPVDDIPHKQQCSHRWNPGGVIDLGGIRQSECGREPIVGKRPSVGATLPSRAQVLSCRDNSCTWTVARAAADLTVDVRWETRIP